MRSSDKATLLSGVALAVLSLTAGLASPVSAATYNVSTEGQLSSAIAAANADGDPTSTIVMTNSFTISSVSLPGASKPVTIDTNGFTLSTQGNTAINLIGSGAPITLLGTVNGSNLAAITSSALAVKGSSYVINEGTIQGGTGSTGTGGAGAEIGGPPAGAATFINNGTVRGGSGATIGGFGLLVRAGINPVVNNGTIEGGNGAVAVTANTATTSIVLVNSGTIRGGVGSADAIRLNASVTTGIIRLELRQGSVIQGKVTGNASQLTDSLMLGGSGDDTFDVSAIGSQYLNFNVFQKTGTSTWTLTGISTALTPWLLDDGTLAVSTDAALGDVAGDLTFDGGTLRALTTFASARDMVFTSDGLITVDAGAELTLSGTLTGPGGMVKLGDGTLIQNSLVGYAGPTTVGGGTLRAGGAGVFSGQYSTLAGGTLDLGGIDQTIASLDNAGNVRLGGAPGTTLTVTGNYVGSGGVISLNTALGDDSSATDRLVVNGNTSGTSSVVVTNIGGAGAQTGPAGIKLVDVVGASTGSFALLGDYVFEGDQAVVGGAYAYRLYQGTETTADGDWYLRSEIIDAGPLYAPTVPLYENYANVLQSFNELGTLQQRVGSRQWLAGDESAAGDSGTAGPNAFWARMDASQADFAPDVSTTGARYGVATWKLQAGVDSQLLASDAGTLLAGVNAQFGTVNSDISSMYGTGSIDALGFGAGGTLTWYGDGGFYLDGQAQVNWFSADIASQSTGTALVEGNGGFGYGLSLEAGQKIALDDNWSLTPQAQLAYSSVGFASFTDPYDGEVSLGDGGDTLTARLGVSAAYENQWRDASGATSSSSLYGVANLYYDFLDGSSVDVSGTTFTSQNQGLWGGIGVGGSLSLADDQYGIYGEALVRGSLDDFSANNALGVKVGFNAKW